MKDEFIYGISTLFLAQSIVYIFQIISPFFLILDFVIFIWMIILIYRYEKLMEKINETIDKN